MNNHTLSQQSLSQLAQYDTPTVCNAIELFEVRPHNEGYMDQSIKACFPTLPPMVGYATTATFRAATPAGDSAYSTLEKQIAAFAELPSPPIIVFQDVDNPTAAATFGEVMCTTYKQFGAAGLITSGAGRDLQQVQALQFPTFTNGSICSHGFCVIPTMQVPVEVGGITISPGDLLHGDLNGVATIPHDIASEVADVCAGIVRAEAVVLEYLKSGTVTPTGLETATAECHRMLDELKGSLH